MLMPVISLHMIRKRNKANLYYKNTFIRNMHERVDLPVFSIEDAIAQIKKNATKAPTES